MKINSSYDDFEEAVHQSCHTSTPLASTSAPQDLRPAINAESSRAVQSKPEQTEHTVTTGLKCNYDMLISIILKPRYGGLCFLLSMCIPFHRIL